MTEESYEDTIVADEKPVQKAIKKRVRESNETPATKHGNHQKTKKEIAAPMPSIPSSSFRRDALIEGMRSGSFRNVCFMVGAGISVAAGIPDFRTPKVGLYAQVKAMGLPVPEDIFSLDYFVEDPGPFYQLASTFLMHQVQPVGAHKFMKQFSDKKLLHMIYTQNIDGLEVDIGIPEKKLVQAHGHMRTAHCCTCKREYPIADFFEYAQRQEVWYCQPCKESKKLKPGIIKPDILFFGEKLSRKFESRFSKIGEADLVIVMGTSLKVNPFSTLLNSIPQPCPLVIINRDYPKLPDRENILFLPGEIEDTVLSLVEDFGWNKTSEVQTSDRKKVKKSLDVT